MGSIAMLRDWPFSAFIGPQNTGGMVSGSVASSVERLLGRRNHREREPPMESKRQRSFDGSRRDRTAGLRVERIAYLQGTGGVVLLLMMQ